MLPVPVLRDRDTLQLRAPPHSVTRPCAAGLASAACLPVYAKQSPEVRRGSLRALTSSVTRVVMCTNHGRSDLSLHPKDTERDTETVLMHGTLVCGAAIKPAHTDYDHMALQSRASKARFLTTSFGAAGAPVGPARRVTHPPAERAAGTRRL